MKKIYVVDLGQIDYLDVIEVQEKLEKKVIENKKIGYLLISENKPVITIGRSAKEGEVLYNNEKLEAMGISKYKTERGGRVTIHGPGQIVGYPIINLESYKKDLHWYLEAIEDIIGETLSDIGIDNLKVTGKTGVWTERGKICAIGVKVKRWVTTHGFALNHTMDLKLFDSINPCGLKEDGVTKIDEFYSGIAREDIIEKIYKKFEEKFICKLIKIGGDELLQL